MTGNLDIGTKTPTEGFDIRDRSNSATICLNGDCVTQWPSVPLTSNLLKRYNGRIIEFSGSADKGATCFGRLTIAASGVSGSLSGTMPGHEGSFEAPWAAFPLGVTSGLTYSANGQGCNANATISSDELESGVTTKTCAVSCT